MSAFSIARRENVGSSYVTRLVYSGCLAPDIVGRILRGQHQAELNAKRLLGLMLLPLDWEEQRRLLGVNI